MVVTESLILGILLEYISLNTPQRNKLLGCHMDAIVMEEEGTLGTHVIHAIEGDPTTDGGHITNAL